MLEGDTVPMDLHAVRGTSMPAGLAVLSGTGVQVGLDLSDAVDTEAEKARLTKQLAKAEKEREGTGRKLANEGFRAKASAETVASIRARNDAGRIVGAIGVIGPTRINYGRIIPVVDYTARIIGQLLG